MSRPLTKLEGGGTGLIVDGKPFSIYLAIEDARRDKQKTVALFRDKDRFDVRTDVEWKLEGLG